MPSHCASEYLTTAPVELGLVPPQPLAERILALLTVSPCGFNQTELTRQLINSKGTGPAMVDLALAQLAQQGAIGRINDNWVCHFKNSTGEEIPL